jgi:F-type H+-transporting ATPase subunit a
MLNNQSNFIINSPLEQFEVTNLLSFNAPIFGYFTLSLSNLALYSILILILILSLHYLSNNDIKLLPSKWSIALESLFSSINSMVREQIGTSNEIYLPAKCYGKILLWDRLSNSGNTLKLLIPNYN